MQSLVRFVSCEAGVLSEVCSVDGAMLADLAEEIVNNINDKPVDLHDALHSIFDGVCRRAAMRAREQACIIGTIHSELCLLLTDFH